MTDRRPGSTHTVRSDSNKLSNSDVEEKAGGPLYMLGETADLPTDVAGGYTASTPEEKRLDRRINLKLDFLVITVLAFNFLLCGMDKTNIGNAATTSFVQDAHVLKDDIGNATSLLSVTFVTLQPFSISLGRRIGPKYYIPLMMLCWGAITMAHAGIHGRGTLIALRLLLGAFEAGFFPTSVYYMSTLYPRYFLGFRLGLFAGMYSVAGAFSGLVAYGCFQYEGHKIKGWQLLFLVEGGITILSAIFTLFWLPKDASTAWFLSKEERLHAVRRVDIDFGTFAGKAEDDDHKVTLRHVKDVLGDWRKMLTVCFNICATLPVSAFGVFMPLMVAGMGYSGVKANLMSVPPFAVGAVGLWCFVYFSDKTKQRAIVTVCGMSLALVGLLVMAVSSNPKLRYGFTHICLAGAFTAGPLIVAWLVGNTPNRGCRALIIGINGYSNIAGVISGQLYKSQYRPSYRTPLIVTLCLIAFGACGFLGIYFSYRFENRRRAKIIANWTPEELAAENNSTERIGDKRLTFVYGY